MVTAPDLSQAKPQTPLCNDCHGAGTVVMSVCCGRGCATCPGGDTMMQAVPCYRCKGSGHITPRSP